MSIIPQWGENSRDSIPSIDKDAENLYVLLEGKEDGATTLENSGSSFFKSSTPGDPGTPLLSIYPGKTSAQVHKKLVLRLHVKMSVLDVA